MRAIRLNSRLLFTVLGVLASFIVPVMAVAEDAVCPCFTAEELMRYASHPAKFVCISQEGLSDRRVLIKGEYFAWFAGSADDDSSCTHNSCTAYVGVGIEEPHVVFLEKYVDEITCDQVKACGKLLTLGDPPYCEE